MDSDYWSIENAGWTSSAGALVTPWSDFELPIISATPPRDAAAVLRLPTREEVDAAAVPAQRDQAEEPATV